MCGDQLADRMPKKVGGVDAETLEQPEQRDLERELDWFAEVLDARLKLYFGKPSAVASVVEIAPPDLNDSVSPYSQFVGHYEWTFAERIVVLLALIPLIRPQLLDVLWSKNEATERGYTELGSEAEQHNTAGIAAHRAMGFRETFRVTQFLKDLAPD